MAKKIMIATHTSLAEGFKKAMFFFTGTGEDIVTVCAYEDTDESPHAEIDSFFASTAPGDTVVVFTDLAGGSVNQILAAKLKTKNFHLITEANLSVIIGIAALSEEEINAENIRENIELGKARIKYINDVLREQDSLPKTNTGEDFF
jgi:mannose/fructose-specific phosphotransferase system component IIA